MKRFIPLLLFALCAAWPLAGHSQTSLQTDPAYLPIDPVLDLKTIHPTVNVNLPHFLLNDALSALTNTPGLEANDLGDALKDIKLIRVIVIEPNQNNRATLDTAMKALRDELDKKWTAIVSVPESNVAVYAMSDPAGESVAGLAVLVYDQGTAVIGNIVGHVAIARLMKLASQKDILKNLQGLGLPPTLFGAQPGTSGAPAEAVTAPPITGPSALSAEEVLKQALAARGGAEALRNIHSFRVHGTIKVNDCPTCGPVSGADATTIDFFEMRPDQQRSVLNFKSSSGQDFGRIDQGFDGRIGWYADLGAAPKLLTGSRFESEKEDGQFFAWYDDPAIYKSMQCLGEASCGGKTCYALKLVFPSGHEETHYYDASTFLLVGLLFTTETETGSSLELDSLGDYQEFGGFKLPTRATWENKWSRGVAQYGTIELNAVAASDLQIPAQ